MVNHTINNNELIVKKGFETIRYNESDRMDDLR